MLSPAWLQPNLGHPKEISTSILVRDTDSNNSLGSEFVGASVSIALKWKKGITTVSEVRYAVLDQDGHGRVIPWRPAPA